MGKSKGKGTGILKNNGVGKATVRVRAWVSVRVRRGHGQG